MAIPKLNVPLRRPRLYLGSLLQEARKLRLVESNVLLSADDLLWQAASQCRKSKKDSLSNIESSLRYTVGLALLHLSSHELALQAVCDAVQQGSIQPLLERGQSLLRRRYLLAASRYALTKQTQLPLPNLAYQRTLTEQIPSFLKKFDMLKNAHCEDFSLSYPSAEPIRNLTGLSRILRYLRALYYENLFLAQFPYEEVEFLYLSYCFSNRFYDVEAPIVNLYRLVLPNAILCEYLQQDSPCLLSARDVKTAERILLTLDSTEREAILMGCANRLFARCVPYYTRTATAVVRALSDALSTGKFLSMLIIDTEKEENP